MSLENAFLQYLYQLHGYSLLIDKFFVSIAHYSSYFFAAVFLVVVTYQVIKRLKYGKKIWWSSILLLPTILLVNYLIRNLIDRERPFVAVEEFSALIYHYYGNSFPSNHAAASFAIAGMVYLFNPLAGKVSFALAALVSFSRIYVGVHYPSDILAGALLAGTILFITIKYGAFLDKWLNNIERRLLRINT